jgi:hypothetical protein
MVVLASAVSLCLVVGQHRIAVLPARWPRSSLLGTVAVDEPSYVQTCIYMYAICPYNLVGSYGFYTEPHIPV